MGAEAGMAAVPGRGGGAARVGGEAGVIFSIFTFDQARPGALFPIALSTRANGMDAAAAAGEAASGGSPDGAGGTPSSCLTFAAHSSRAGEEERVLGETPAFSVTLHPSVAASVRTVSPARTFAVPANAAIQMHTGRCINAKDVKRCRTGVIKRE